ncbi:hypothetical protein [uncultured Acinetobacter sp.]|uniref:hypothetical protein n=1 Tax=uncultured Acinetobacter sp. TaxID=165433 RepID=UPI003748C9AC
MDLSPYVLRARLILKIKRGTSDDSMLGYPSYLTGFGLAHFMVGAGLPLYPDEKAA